jgi:hypothetical protein
MNTKYVEESDDARKYEYALKWKIHDTLSRLTWIFRRYIYAGLCIRLERNSSL